MARVKQLAAGIAMILASGIAACAAEASPPATEPTIAELQAQLKALQDRVNQLEARHPTTAPTAAEVDATVKAVLQDADRRSQLLAVDGFTSGFDNGRFVIRSADGNYSISPVLLWQFRSATTYREHVGA